MSIDGVELSTSEGGWKIWDFPDDTGFLLDGGSSDAGSAPTPDANYRGAYSVFEFDGAAKTNKATLDAIGRSLAIIEFDPTGKIFSANENFCKALGYQASEILGQHHSLFVEPEYGRSARNIANSGPNSAGANSTLASTRALVKADGRSGSRRRTVR